MKKKLILFLSIVVLCVVMLAISVSATTYNYYNGNGYDSENYGAAIGENNLLYSVITEVVNDAKNTASPRFEAIVYERGDGFAMYDGEGNPISWYVVSNTPVYDKTNTTRIVERNIVVKSALTIGGVGSVNENGVYSYDKGIAMDQIVSANFFGTGVKTLPDNAFQADIDQAKEMPAVGLVKNTYNEFCVIAGSKSNLLCLYLPKTLTAIPANMCYRSPVRVLEFEDNKIGWTAENPNTSVCTTIPSTAFRLCANLKSISIPEGITTLQINGDTRPFRECISIDYAKLPSTLTTTPEKLFWRCTGINTIIFGENTTYVNIVSKETGRYYVGSWDKDFNMKYMYIPSTVTCVKNPYEYFNGTAQNVGNAKKLVFMYMGTEAEAFNTQKSSDGIFKEAYKNRISYDTYMKDKANYDNSSTHILVYGVSKCDVYYNEKHIVSNEANTYTDVISPFEIGTICERCNKTYDVESYEPILTFLGYSVQENGNKLCLGYNTNSDSLAVCPDISIGALVASGDKVTDNYEPLKPDSTPNVDGFVFSSIVDKKNTSFNIIINNFDSAYYDRSLIMCAYVTDGKKVDYLCLDEYNNLVQQEYASAISFRYIVEEYVTKYKVEVTYDDNMGTIDNPLQAVVEGESTTVTATPKEGHTFLGWSNGEKNATIEITPTDDMTLKAVFIPLGTETVHEDGTVTQGLPVMTINTATGYPITTKEYYVDCEISLLDNTGLGKNVVSAVAEIKGRGNSTWNLEKKPYKFKFDKKQDLFGFGKEKTWVLLADHRDYSLLRNMLALNVALSLDTQGFTSKGQSVELYLNGEYQGVYYLCEQIQVKENRVNITEEDDGLTKPEEFGYLVEMDGWAIKNASSTPNLTKDGDVYVQVGDSLVSNRRYAIKDPEDILLDENGKPKAEFIAYVQGFIKDALDAVNGKDYAKVNELIDIKSFAQAYIVFELFANPDTNYSSVYFYKDVNGKFTCGPVWDFDMALGNVSHKGNGVFKDPTTLWTATQNPWFKGLLRFDEFKALVASELRANEAGIKATIANCIQYAKDHADAYKRNFGDETEWEIGENTFSIPTYLQNLKTWEEQVAYVENYLNESFNGLLAAYPVAEDAQ